MSKNVTTISMEFHASMAHIITGHPGKCARAHGHNYKIGVCIMGEIMEDTGLVCDFGILKKCIKDWIDAYMDHCFLIQDTHPLKDALEALDIGVIAVPFNPSVENLAKHLAFSAIPALLAKPLLRDINSSMSCAYVDIEETPGCSSTHIVREGAE